MGCFDTVSIIINVPVPWTRTGAKLLEKSENTNGEAWL